MNYVIIGEDKFLMEQKLSLLKKEYDISEENMNLSVYWANETDLSFVVEDALTPPFFSEYKMVVLKNPFFFTAKKQKELSEEKKKTLDNRIQLLMDYLSHDNPNTLFVVYHDEMNFDSRKKIVKDLKKYAQYIEIDKMDDKQLFKVIHNSVKSRGCKMDNDALELLLSRVPNELLEISNEINKLCLYTKHIKVEDVNLLVSKRLEDNIFDLTNAILDKDVSRSISIYRDLRVNNEEPIKLIIMIANALRLLYQVKLLDRKGYNDQEIGTMLSINPYRLKYIRQNGKSYEINELLKKIDDLSVLDVKIKTGQIDRFLGLELFLMRIGE